MPRWLILLASTTATGLLLYQVLPGRGASPRTAAAQPPPTPRRAVESLAARGDRQLELRRIIAGRMHSPSDGGPVLPPTDEAAVAPARIRLPAASAAPTTATPEVVQPVALRGRALGGNGVPLFFALVEVVPVDRPQSKPLQTHSRLDGRFGVKVPAAGFYRVRLRALLDQPQDPPVAEQVVRAPTGTRSAVLYAAGPVVSCRQLSPYGHPLPLYTAIMRVNGVGRGHRLRTWFRYRERRQGLHFLWPHHARRVMLVLRSPGFWGRIELRGPGDRCEAYQPQ